MALQVWLPLNGNLNNQGLSNVSVTNSGATVNSAGKIGSCYGCKSTGYLSFVANFGTVSEFTISYWVKVPQTITTAAAWQTMIRFPSINDTTTATSIIDWASYNQMKIFDEANHQHAWITVPYDTWIHYAVVNKWDGTTNYVDIYQNGVKYGSYTSAKALKLTSGTWKIGEGINATYGPMYFNDFRIYDHCLSPKEVKEISKGLVLHYKLDDPYVEGTTNIASSLTPQANKGGWVKLTATQLGLNAYHFKHKTTDSSNLSYWSTFVYTLPSEYANKTISFSARLKNIKYENLAYNGSTSWLFIGQGNDGQYPTHGSVTKYFTQLEENMVVSWTGTLTNSYRYLVIELWNNAASVDGYIELDVVDIQIEQKDHATPYTESSRSGVPVYDCSGYGRNGTTAGNIYSDSDTPRLGRSCYLSTINDSITINPVGVFAALTNCSIAVWIKVVTKGTSGWLPFSGQTNQYYIMATTNGTGTFYHNNIGSNTKVIYKDGVASGIPGAVGEWHHYVITGVDLSTWTNLDLNEYQQASNWNFGGKWSDLRIYSTVLSEADIKDLYQTSAAIHNTGNIEAFEFVEDGDSNIKKTGIVESGYFFEKGDNLKTLSDGSVWLRLLHHNNPASYMFTSSNCWDYNDGINLYSKLGWLKTGNWTNANGEYEFLFVEKLTSSSSESEFRWKQTSNPSLSSTLSGYQVVSGNPDRSVGLMNKGFAAAMHNGNSFWCECGAYSGYNNGIAGVNGTVTTGFLDLYVRLVGPAASGIDDSARIYANTISGNQIIEI